MNKKEELIVFHQKMILNAADRLFTKKGVDKTTVEEIAKEAQYSKATIYVYFTSKEEIFYRLVYNCANDFKNVIKNVIDEDLLFKEKYFKVCREIVSFQKNSPIYFEGFIGDIETDIENPKTLGVFKDIYYLGNKINEIIFNLLREGKEEGLVNIKHHDNETLLFLWSSISGIVRMSSLKKKYVKKLGIDLSAFLESSFLKLYNSLK